MPEKEIEDLIKNAPEFKPYISYNPTWDEFKILIQNCSVTERTFPWANHLTLLYSTHGPGHKRLIGVTIGKATSIFEVPKEVLRGFESISQDHPKIVKFLIASSGLSEEAKDLIYDLVEEFETSS